MKHPKRINWNDVQNVWADVEQANRLAKQRRQALKFAQETAYRLIPQVQLERCLIAQRGWTFIRHNIITGV